jgi:hypothetical protein
MLQVDEGPQERAAAEWDARAVHQLGSIIGRILLNDPPPPGSRYAESLRRWSEDLQAVGRADLLALGVPLLLAAAA